MVDDLVVRTADAFREKAGIDVRLNHEATAIDTAASMVHGRDGDGNPFELPYDRLLIATGADPIRIEHPGFDLPGVMTVKTLDDARAIKNRLDTQPVRQAVIIGMGYIAMEMAEALCLRGVAVNMVKPRPNLLPWLADELAEAVRQELEGNQVGLHTGVSVDRLTINDDRLVVMAQSGETFTADLVIVAVGVKPNNALAAKAKIALGPAGAIAVDRQMRTSVEGVYAAGDCADAFHVVTGERAWIPLALRANRAGWAAADHLSGRAVTIDGVAGTGVFKVFGLEVARTGLTHGEATRAGFEPVHVTIKARSRAHAHPGSAPIHVHLVGDRLSGRLLGAQLVGRDGAAHRINAPAVALHAGMGVEQFSQADMAYAPPFGPTWDPLLVAANQLIKTL